MGKLDSADFGNCTEETGDCGDSVLGTVQDPRTENSFLVLCESVVNYSKINFMKKTLNIKVHVSVCCRYGAKWESSFLCRLSGFLFVFASQTGLFLLTVAALERCLAAARHNTDGHSGEGGFV